MRTKVIGLVIAAMMMTVPAATAVAQADQECVIGERVLDLGYDGVAVPIKGPCDPPPHDPPGGDLPFTGAETGLVGLAGLALVGFGMALRRLK